MSFASKCFGNLSSLFFCSVLAVWLGNGSDCVHSACMSVHMFIYCMVYGDSWVILLKTSGFSSYSSLDYSACLGDSKFPFSFQCFCLGVF